MRCQNSQAVKIFKKYQKNYIKKNKRCVLEGRDASTKILPNSDIKLSHNVLAAKEDIKN